MFGAIPFLAIIVIAYNVIALLTGPALSHAVMSATLPSGAAWTLDVGDLLIIVGIALLFLEIAKATRSRRAGVDHALSMVLFLIITTLTLIDVIAGFTVSLSTARRDIAIT